MPVTPRTSVLLHTKLTEQFRERLPLFSLNSWLGIFSRLGQLAIAFLSLNKLVTFYLCPWSATIDLQGFLWVTSSKTSPSLTPCVGELLGWHTHGLPPPVASRWPQSALFRSCPHRSLSSTIFMASSFHCWSARCFDCSAFKSIGAVH